MTVVYAKTAVYIKVQGNKRSQQQQEVTSVTPRFGAI